MCVFLVTLSALFFILAAYSSRSPYAEIGADRETLQVMAYEPMILFVAIGMVLSIGTFDVAGLMASPVPIIVATWPIFLGLLFVLTIKLRKSPFDLSYSHHAHQELVKGVTTEMSGRTLAKVEVMHWCENVLFPRLGCALLRLEQSRFDPAGRGRGVGNLFLRDRIDNNFARVKWQSCLSGLDRVSLVA
ncbi:MAG: NADH-quinone oxidoreductase subunit H [Eggerthellaceae bacterium]